MAKKKRIRLEKNKKSGTKWTEQELRKVIEIFPETKDSIHETNPKIIALGKKIGRTTRSVEAQLIMFRTLDRGGDYSWDRMSNLCKKIYNESQEEKNLTPAHPNLMTEIKETESTQLYPAGLLKWSGHRSGGVRKPFRSESGRPAGKINTPLTDRLEQWAKQLPLDTGRKLPYCLLLVGGPGNGKTDAIERCISSLDHELKAGGKLLEKFAEEFKSDCIPRDIEVDLLSLGISLPDHLRCKIKLVQDASEAPDSVPAERLFLEDLSKTNNDIYLCCINRGILANASNLARSSKHKFEYELLETITTAVTASSKSISCWPLENNPRFAVWPMDVDSLVDSNATEDGVTIAHKVFNAALDDSKWQENCKLGKLCPFCTNKQLLSDPKHLNNLVSILRSFELKAGKRWTFRDLFSLVPYLLVGDPAELSVDGNQLSPCDWAKHQTELAEKSGKNVDEACAIYRLAGRLYYHRLFPVWPSLNKGEFFNAKKDVFKKDQLDPDIVVAKNLFRFLKSAEKSSSRAGGAVPNTIRNEFSVQLDPSNVDISQEVFQRGKGKEAVRVEDIENWFSLSVENGFKNIDRRISKIEKEVFKRLIRADNALTEDNFSRIHWSQIGLLQRAVRQFAARFAKRCLCVKSGIVADFRFLQEFEKLNYSDEAMDAARRQLRNLLHESDGGAFRAGLATTFGQPLATRERDVALIVQEKIKVKKVSLIEDDSRPKSQLRFLKISDFDIPLTFQLYKALFQLGEGLKEASLGSDIFSLIDRVKALVAGSLVRSQSVLEDEPYIQIGLNHKIDIEPNNFSFQRIQQ